MSSRKTIHLPERKMNLISSAIPNKLFSLFIYILCQTPSGLIWNMECKEMMINEPIYMIYSFFLSPMLLPFYHHHNYGLWLRSWIHFFLCYRPKLFFIGGSFSEKVLRCVLLLGNGTILQEYAEVNLTILQTMGV